MGISKKRKIDIKDKWNIITKNKTTCFIGKYFKHLKEPNNTEDISQMVYSKAKKLEKGQGQKEIDLKSFAPTMRAEHPPKYIFSKKKIMTAYKYIGNAVPPLLGYLIADKVTEIYKIYFT